MLGIQIPTIVLYFLYFTWLLCSKGNGETSSVLRSSMNWLDELSRETAAGNGFDSLPSRDAAVERCPSRVTAAWNRFSRGEGSGSVALTGEGIWGSTVSATSSPVTKQDWVKIKVKTAAGRNQSHTILTDLKKALKMILSGHFFKNFMTLLPPCCMPRSPGGRTTIKIIFNSE